MVAKYFDYDGLSYFVSKIKKLFVTRPTTLTIDTRISTINVGDTVSLSSHTDVTDDSIIYLSNNTSYLEVTPKGDVTGLKSGTATIYVVPTNNLSLTYTIEVVVTSDIVEDALVSSVTSISSTLGDGTYDISSIIITNNGTDVTSSVTWSSSDETVFTVTDNTITFASVGEANLVATYNTLSVEIPVTITSIGQVNSDNTISLSLDSGTYTLKYEDETNTPLEDFDEITTLTI